MNDIAALLPHIQLQFNIEHPAFEECYQYGYQCAIAEITEEENPFAEGSEEAFQWSEGWWAGFYAEEPLFDSAVLAEENAHIDAKPAANDTYYHKTNFMALVFEISGAIAASALVGYQLIELVA
jgi:hypothetical protein